MKKQYKQPQTELQFVTTTTLMAASGDSGDGLHLEVNEEDAQGPAWSPRRYSCLDDEDSDNDEDE